MSNSKFQSSREMLQTDYERRRKKNPKFSKRAYANLLGLSSGRLSDLLSGKTPLTEKKARSIVYKLGFSAKEKIHFLLLAEKESRARLKTTVRNPVKSYRLSLDEFSFINDWEFFSLISLIQTSTFKSDRGWIAKKLGISPERLDQVLDHLVNLRFIEIDEKNNISTVYQSLSTVTDIPSDMLKKANATRILQSLEKMNEIDPLWRDVTSMTFPVNPDKITEAKVLIRRFKAKMAKMMGQEKTSEIYSLNIQLVPISKLGV